jgi:hypothetical protein
MNAFDKERRARILELLDPRGSDGENADAVLGFLKEEVRTAYIRGLQAGRKGPGAPRNASGGSR